MFGMMESVISRLDRLENASLDSHDRRSSSGFGQEDKVRRTSGHKRRSHSVENNFSNFKCYNAKDAGNGVKKIICNNNKGYDIDNVALNKVVRNVKDKGVTAKNSNKLKQAQSLANVNKHSLVDYGTDSYDSDYDGAGSVSPSRYAPDEGDSLTRDFHGDYDYRGDFDVFSDPGNGSGGDSDIHDYDNSGFKARLKDIRMLFRDISSHHPQYFVQDTKDLPFYQNPDSLEARKYIRVNKQVPCLKVAPDLSGSWFDPQYFEDPNDCVAVWGPDTKFPSKSRLYPQDYSRKSPPRIPYVKVEDPQVERFLKAAPIKDANLDAAVFGSASFQVGKFTHSTVDGILRGSLQDCFISDEIFKILITLVAKIDEEHHALGGVGHITTLDSVMQLLLLGAETNVRTEQQVVGALVANKVGLRDRVLNSFIMPTWTKNTLRGSNFLSDKLFGDLPESFKNLVLSENGKHLRARHRGGKSFQSSFSFPINRFASSGNPSGFFGRPRFGNKFRTVKRLQGSAGRFDRQRSDSRKRSRFFQNRGRRARN